MPKTSAAKKKSSSSQASKSSSNHARQRSAVNDSSQSLTIVRTNAVSASGGSNSHVTHRATSKKTKSTGIWLFLGILIVIMVVGIGGLVVYKFAQNPQYDGTTAAQDYAYQLTGDPAWIYGRDWQVLNANKQVIATSTDEGAFTLDNVNPGEQFTVVHPDWRIEFVGQAGASPSTDVSFDFGGQPAQALSLDKELDNFANTFATDVTYNKWAELTSLIDPASLPSQMDSGSVEATRQMLTLRFNDWFKGLTVRNLSLDDIDVYYNLNNDLTMDGRLVLVWTFTDKNSGGQTLITTNVEFVKVDDPANPYRWKFSMGAFPQL